MQPMTIPEIISAVDGTWLNPRKGAAPVTAVCTDSRKIAPGCLFLPWVGERFDGHDFAAKALETDACVTSPSSATFFAAIAVFSSGICFQSRCS